MRFLKEQRAKHKAQTLNQKGDRGPLFDVFLKCLLNVSPQEIPSLFSNSFRVQSTKNKAQSLYKKRDLGPLFYVFRNVS
ncbi:MAG: hypothetical protein RLZZ402_1916 [Bacteroidota bacterium]|jgi:hypothetical protein